MLPKIHMFLKKPKDFLRHAYAMHMFYANCVHRYIQLVFETWYKVKAGLHSSSGDFCGKVGKKKKSLIWDIKMLIF